MSDATPLIAEQYDALFDVWTKLNLTCTTTPTNCQLFTRDKPCPELGRALYGPHLICRDGQVTHITIDDEYPSTGGILSTSIGLLTGLVELLVHDRHEGLHGTIPTQMGQLSDLVVLNLCCNVLTGSIPTELAQLTALRQIGLHVNELSGSIPRSLSTIKSLYYVRFYRNQLTGVAPRFVGVSNESSDASWDKCEIVVANGANRNDYDSNCFSDCEQAQCCAFCCAGKPCSMVINATTTTPNITIQTSTAITTTALRSAAGDPRSLAPNSSVAVAGPAPNDLPAIVGGVVGAAVFLLILLVVGVVIFVVVRRRRRRAEQQQRSNATANNTATMQSVVVQSVQSEQSSVRTAATEYAAVSVASFGAAKPTEYDVGNLEMK
jgi:hypothetical protein